METSGQNEVLSLPQLQSLMKKDPEAYTIEFEQQWSHFDSMMEIFKTKPQKPQKTFGEQVMFLAHVTPSFPTKTKLFYELIIKTLGEHYQVLHPMMRKTLVQALILLRNRDQFPCIRTLPVYFKLFSLPDKLLRTTLFGHIIRDIVMMNQKSKCQKVNAELRDFFYGQLKEGEVDIARRACAVFVSLFRQNIWKDATSINLMSAGLLHPDTKIVAALCHLFLGNKTKGLTEIIVESEDEEDDGSKTVIKGLLGSKKTASRLKKIKRAKKAVKKTKNKDKGDTTISYIAVDMLNDPQTLAERLLQRVNKGGEPFMFRILVLHLVARLVGRHELHLINLYAFLIKYLSPSQREVTSVMACLVEACHASVPPEELRPAILHILNNFVSDACAPEVIEVGLNTIREVCRRSVNVLTEDELADLVGFRKHKNKGVMSASKSLINVYRELHPQLLHSSLRGREASVALGAGELAEGPQFGASRALDGIDGLELLAKQRRRKGSKDKDDEDDGGSDGEGDESEKEQENLDKAVASTKALASEQVLSQADFKQMRRLKLQRSVALQMGKRTREEMSDSDSSKSGSGSSDEEEEEGLPGAMSAAELKSTAKRRKNKEGRVKHADADFDWKEENKKRVRNGGKTNKETKRNKPMMMQLQSKGARKKKMMDSKGKMAGLKKHIKTLKKKVGGKQKRRR